MIRPASAGILAEVVAFVSQANKSHEEGIVRPDVDEDIAIWDVLGIAEDAYL